MTQERRTQRSPDLENALALWFRSVAQRCGTDVVALSTATGTSVASIEHEGRRPSAETALIPVMKFSLHNQPLFLWARGARGTARAAITEAEAGLHRILDGHF